MENVTRNAVEVTIEGQTYALRSDLGSEDVREIAQYLDETIREIKKRSPTMAPTRLAILAALNVAEELFRVRETCAGIAKKTGDLIRFMDQKLFHGDSSLGQ